ncbi:ATP-binding protein [Rhabdochromatium marinum]|uniref:ATP-binding protein n=1 Tax=Rhabdochromatium marinum TaxID=48729 RepID=UPI00190823B4|nr:AAA family ATPase [Rhabdochromatium marinum]MBK1650383.1 hypothetical protein [Rhabdochromatium marinum]
MPMPTTAEQAPSKSPLITQRLYGREPHLRVLMEAFERVCCGHGEVLLLPGTAGVGKTTLVQAIADAIREKNGFFCQGKFNQYQQGLPYAAFQHAFAELWRHIREESRSQQQQWRQRILQRVGDFGSLLFEIAPKFAALIGPQSALSDISPQEARYRFDSVLNNFLDLFCQPEHPLVLFIDDWQWADTASLQMLEKLPIGSELRYLLLIAAYRDDEVEASHPLTTVVQGLRQHQVSLQTLEVHRLGLDAQRELMHEALPPQVIDPEGLAQVIDRHTQGNPFFIHAFLSFIHEVGLLVFDQGKNAWWWSVQQLGAQYLPEDVVELFARRFRQLDPESVRVLTHAACLGNRFDLERLALVTRRSTAFCLALLEPLIEQGLLRPVGDGATQAGALPSPLCFVHDRVQQAAYSLLAPEQVLPTKLAIGWALYAHDGAEAPGEQLFQMVEHLQAGCHLIVDRDQRFTVIELSLVAARKARAATAYSSALAYHRAAGAWLDDPHFADWLWQTHHGVAMSLLQGWSDSEFIEGDRRAARVLLEQAVARAQSAMERAQVLNVLIVQHTLQANYMEAIEAGRQGLEALGVQLPEADYERVRDAEIAQVMATLAGRDLDTLAAIPEMQDPQQRMIVQLLITMGPPCYRAHQRLWSVLVPKVVDLTLRHGHVPQIGYSHTAFAGLLIWVRDDFATARLFTELATRLMTRTFLAPTEQSVFYLMIGSSARFWFEPLARSSHDYTEAYEVGLRASNLQYAAYAFGHNMYCRLYLGIPLSVLREETEQALAFSRTRFNQWAIELLEGGLRVIDSLCEEAENPAARLSDERACLHDVEARGNVQVACIDRILRTFREMLLGHHEEALALSEEVAPMLYMVGTQGLLPWPMHLCTRFLILSALHPWVDIARQQHWEGELRELLAKLRHWAERCPENFSPAYLVAEAELARLEQRGQAAMQLFRVRPRQDVISRSML